MRAPFMPQAVDAKEPGLHVAVVTNNETGDPLRPLELRIAALPGGTKTALARWLTPLTGDGIGTFALPETGDQVLVAFEQGDYRRPIVVGSLWSTAAPPPEQNSSGQNNTKLFRSRSGHRLIFSDKEGAEQVIVSDKAGNHVALDGAGNVRIQCAGTLLIKASEHVVVASSTLRVLAKTGITIKAGGKLSLLAGSSKKVIARGSLSFTAPKVHTNMSAPGPSGASEGHGDLGPARR